MQVTLTKKSADPQQKPSGLHSSLLDQLEIVGIDPEEEPGEEEILEDLDPDEEDVDDFVDEDEFEDEPEMVYMGDGGSRAGSSSMFSSNSPNLIGHAHGLPKTVSSVALSRKLDAPYQCNICGKSYVHSCTLVQHRKLHEGQTRCTLCSQTLSNVSNLRAHYQTVHGYSNAEVQGKFVFQIKPSNAPPRW